MSVFKIESNGKMYVFNLVKFDFYDKRGNGYILETDNASNLKDLTVGQKVDKLDIVQGVGQVARSLSVKEINDKTLTLIHNYIVK
jgi:hypothetical protein